MNFVFGAEIDSMNEEESDYDYKHWISQLIISHDI